MRLHTLRLFLYPCCY